MRTYNKLHVFEFPGERVFVLLSAGNLATTQAVLANINRDLNNANAPTTLRNVMHMYDAAEYLGALSVRSQRETAANMQSGSTVDLRTTLILGGQIRGEEPALYLIYPEGNCISSSPDTPYLQIGELKYGKPILDRIIRPYVSLEDASRCALVSMDSTMKSNLSVGPPIDLVIVPTGALRITRRMRLDFDTPLFAQIREGWGRELVRAFRNLPRFDWEVQQEISFQQAASQQQTQN